MKIKFGLPLILMLFPPTAHIEFNGYLVIHMLDISTSVFIKKITMLADNGMDGDDDN